MKDFPQTLHERNVGVSMSQHIFFTVKFLFQNFFIFFTFWLINLIKTGLTLNKNSYFEQFHFWWHFLLFLICYKVVTYFWDQIKNIKIVWRINQNFFSFLHFNFYFKQKQLKKEPYFMAFISKFPWRLNF